MLLDNPNPKVHSQNKIYKKYSLFFIQLNRFGGAREQTNNRQTDWHPITLKEDFKTLGIPLEEEINFKSRKEI